MFILQWKPYAECSNSERDPPVLSACNSVLNQLPASKIPETFGAQGTADIDVPLPVKYSDCQSVTCSSSNSSSSDPPFSGFCLHTRSIDNRSTSNGQLVRHVDLCCVNSSNVCEISQRGCINW